MSKDKEKVYVVMSDKVYGTKDGFKTRGDTLLASDMAKSVIAKGIKSGDLTTETDAKKAEKAAKDAEKKAQDLQADALRIITENKDLKKENKDLKKANESLLKENEGLKKK